ncbi:MAG: hypothetical protein WD382_07990 [Halofilum sp. (in: g-proteobacteria)]
MRTRRGLITIALALCTAAVLTWTTTPMSATERVIRIEAAEALPHLAGDLERWSVDVNAALLHYADDERLTLAAQLALVSYPEAAENVLALYGTTEPFKDILREYGARVVLPIQYLVQHDSRMLRLRHRAGTLLGDDEGPPDARADAPGSGLAPITRGGYAIGFIEEEGHDFLGQFVVDAQGDISWVQSERFATGAKRFFTSGLTTLESKWRQDEAIVAGDYAWAAVDVLVPIAAVRAVKVARAGRLAGTGGRTIRLAARPAGAVATLATAGYLVTHPSLIGDVAHGIADALSVPGWLVELTIWFVLLLPLLIAFRFVYRWLFRPTRRLLLTGIALLRWLHRRLSPRPQAL